ncbi:MAG: hypothetical protein IPJ31_03440 [Bacteroidetes bacterium]|nr:hypothetical protein [Bacteroidota bacterium]MBP6315728.1 hypothetical protein [Chitinophagaceae bacterium]
MKKIISLIVILCLLHATNLVHAQGVLKKTMEIKVAREGGANGAGVVWHPKLKKYYLGMAGNEIYPLLVTDASGKILSDVTLECMVDLRGFWYNPKVNAVQCNGYDSYGWRQYELDSKGIPTGTKILYDGLNQPDANSVGAYDPSSNKVYFLSAENNMEFSVYLMSTGMFDQTMKLHLQNTSSNELNDQPGLSDEYNSTTAIYTGLPNKQFLLLNIDKERVEFYNVKGFMTGYKQFPPNTKLEDRFNFSFANGLVWIFNKESRIWTAFK